MEEKTQMEKDLDEIQLAAEKIVLMCKDRQLGLMSWYDMLNFWFKKMKNKLTEIGV